MLKYFIHSIKEFQGEEDQNSQDAEYKQSKENQKGWKEVESKMCIQPQELQFLPPWIIFSRGNRTQLNTATKNKIKLNQTTENPELCSGMHPRKVFNLNISLSSGTSSTAHHNC